MPLIKDRAFAEDTFTRVGDGEPLPAGAVIVPLARFVAERDALLRHAAPVGVRIASDQSPEVLGDDVRHLSVIEIEFPKFRDGRGYTWARLLRERLGYAGEIRAVGEVLRDQWLYMWRCGIDAFEVRPGTRLEDFEAALAEQTVFYQPARDRRPTVLSLRHAPFAQAAE